MLCSFLNSRFCLLTQYGIIMSYLNLVVNNFYK
ncbi:hypothetical protein [Escherichia phage UPEC01]|nr:hypothetical protein [Escherichia phage UPEC01]WMU95714.1 hypothetical protein [Escherichia phage pEC-M719-6WT.2]